MIKKYGTVPVNGTRTSKEIKSFFGSKLIDIEDDIYVTDISIQYSEVVDKISPLNDHYQYYDQKTLPPETKILRSLSDIKYESHSIDIYRGSAETPNTNFEWIIVIDVKNILKQYLFLRLKESRVFRCIKSEDLVEKNIDNYIYEYINDNLLNRYNTSGIAFYAKYIDVVNKISIFDTNQVLRGPKFNKDVYNENYRIKNVNVMTPDYLSNLESVKVIFNQTKPNDQYKFDYYFNVSFHKI